MKKHYSEEEKAVCREIGYFYLNKYQQELEKENLSVGKIINKLYEKTYETISNLGITNVSFLHTKDTVNGDLYSVTIYLNRPGVFIGEKGLNKEAITEHLKENLKISNLNIHIVEDNIVTYLYPSFFGDEY